MTLREQVARAMDDLLANARGHVPPSAEKFYDGRTGRFSLPQEALSVVEGQRGWQPIEAAPRDDGSVLLWCNGIELGYFYRDYWWIEGGQVTCEPTHWQPLPQPPHVIPMEGE